MNIDNKDKTFYSVDNGNTWNKSSFAGSVMIQPLFSTSLDNELGIIEKPSLSAKKWIVYPNPSTGVYQFNNDANEEWNLLDFTGRIMMNGKESLFDISHLPNGVYFLQPTLSPQNSIKLIKQ